MRLASEKTLRKLNTFKLEATADHYFCGQSVAEIDSALMWARERELPVTVLGEGSNVLLRPRVRGMVLNIANSGVKVVRDDGVQIQLQIAAGENWHSLVRWSSAQGFHGLENLALIPGSVGAAPVQNIGAYGVEVAKHISAVHAISKQTGDVVRLSNAECRFRYRDSFFKSDEGRDLVITAVELMLDRNAAPIADYPSLAAELGDRPRTQKCVMEAVCRIRSKRLPDPLITPNVGSMFKNPTVSWHDAELMSMRWPDLPQYPTDDGTIKLSAAWMIEQLGWRGNSADGAEGLHVSPDHALIIINAGAEQLSAVMALTDAITDSVERHFGVVLELEPDVIG